jgi:microcystin-dependent protein
MSTPTTNFNWLKPTVGGDTDIWGGTAGLNYNLDSQDSLLRRFMNTFILSTEPAERQSGTFWIDNSVNPWVWKVYNSTGTPGWVTIGSIDPTTNTFTPVSGSGDGFEVGDIKTSTIASNHGKWLLCNGAAISRATYSDLDALFASLTPQYPFGDGDGSTTFNLPDMRGRVPGCIGAGTGLTVRAIGTEVGTETHTLVSTELPDPLTSAAGLASFTFGSGTTTAGIPSTATAGSGIIANGGGGQAHQNMQPTLFVGNYFIYTGV